MNAYRWARVLLTALTLALGAAGCLQLETKITLKEDGSATVTERLAFSQRLLEMASGNTNGADFHSLLSREAALERAHQMGPGVTLKSHETRDGEKGARESVATFDIPELTNLVYVSPFFGWRQYQSQALKIGLLPNLAWSGQHNADPPGRLIVTFQSHPHPAGATAQPPSLKASIATPGNSPLDVQSFRELVPLFADILDDLRILIRFESYCPIANCYGLAHRDASSRVSHTDLINLSGRQMDKYGYRFVENEEIMTDLLQSHIGLNPKDPSTHGPFWSDHLANMRDNPTLPLIHQTGRASILIAPSPALFKKHLEGKTLDWSATHNLTLKARGRKQADFNEVGWKPQVLETRDTGDVCPTNCPWCR